MQHVSFHARVGKRAALSFALVAAVAAVWWALMPEAGKPSYKGKTIARWFADFCAAGGHSKWISGENTETTHAFVAGFGAEALPFLDRVVRRPTPLRETKGYAKFVSAVPSSVARKLPPVQRDSKVEALQLIAAIGSSSPIHNSSPTDTSERRKREATRTLTWALSNPTLRNWALQGIAQMGPGGFEALPSLLALLKKAIADRDPRGTQMVLNAIGGLQMGASNAVPVITAVVTDSQLALSTRMMGALCLGEIGQPARSAGPAVGRLFVERARLPQNGKGVGLEMILASIGNVPQEAIPGLQKVWDTRGPLPRAYAAVALWSHEPENEAYRNRVRMLLKAPLAKGNTEFPDYCAGPTIATVAEHGRMALVFEPELRELAESRCIYSQMASHALIRLRGGTNFIQTRKF